ncbi:bifunctional DNA-formamidopyrimidine glycosylase/DNA-(apurinic or apyrimidinic site) lyase [Gulosibacter sp. 10]|uniref:bifunctional DNA-formamidopyrimidine glycosylase/DNA-(apurinic or apyrimidinic site) lyase n=1 Tax=Gulosibacter sp. 10 TaxID=1255570 RepID=UPI00097EF6B1|nr:bifunctional DNA-formamidopyrimidine glycosylase/DNA-(apurinic or apyrimidinic site) lyase [Gulosibacter sp. 10]SJM62223.1 Formamidopyrimidine-DNA glycosylase [Gulosibacter sp. 10]
MPELPEVEVVRLGLTPALAGATVTAVEVHDSRALKRHVGSELDFVSRIEGRVLRAPSRRGKFLWVPFAEGDDALLAHLGMSGQMIIRAIGAPEDRQLRIRMRVEGPAGEYELRFLDQRLFGSLAVTPLVAAPDHPEERIPDQVRHIARDPLDPEFDDAFFRFRLRSTSRSVKSVLLDQAVVSGIGNIYADEALWRARLHWRQPGASISTRKAGELLDHVRDVFDEALLEGGTSFDSLYVNVNGESGYFARRLKAYGRERQPCERCGRAIKREAFANRSSYRCPGCQRLRRK